MELLDHALDLFLDQGFERTTIDAIAASAGMAKRTLYLRYKDKKALFKAALERAIEAWIVPVERLKAAETDDLEDSLQRIGHALVDNILSPAGLRLMRITNAESGRMPEIGVFTLRQGTERTTAYLADLFRRHIHPNGGKMPNADHAAMAFLYLVVGGPANMTAWGNVLDQAAIDALTTYNIRLFLHGILAEDKQASASRRRLTAGQANSHNIGVPDAVAAQKMQMLQRENDRLKRLLAEAMLDAAELRDIVKGSRS
jgi:AcrR family transcriptional regulator